MGAEQSSSSSSSSSAGASSSSHRSRSRARHGHRGRGHWSASAPKSVGDRAAVLNKCGRKCFLGPGKSFPICARLGAAGSAGTCKIDRHGVQAAYSRASEWASITARKKRSSGNARQHRKYTAIAKRAKSLLKRKGL
jgi:hypothetical protein